MKSYPSLLLRLFLLAAGSAFQLHAQPKETVLLVSFDGFRSDYVEKYSLQNFKAFAAAGTSSQGIVPCFPSLTFPNHYSIVTGMYPGNHGLVDNNFYDSIIDIQYAIRNRVAVEDARFYGGTPCGRWRKRMVSAAPPISGLDQKSRTVAKAPILMWSTMRRFHSRPVSTLSTPGSGCRQLADLDSSRCIFRSRITPLTKQDHFPKKQGT